MGPWFTAGYDGECDECGAFIEAGEDVRYDDTHALLCAVCGEED